MISDVLIYFVGIPGFLAYLLVLIAFSDKKRGKIEHLAFPLRDAIVATLALDFVVLIPQLFDINKEGVELSLLSPAILSMILFAAHFSLLTVSERLSIVKQQVAATTHKKRLVNLVLVTYIGLFCLMTNAVSIQAVLTGKGAF